MALRVGQQIWVAPGVSQTTWSGLLNGDTGTPEQAGAYTDITFHAKGTFGAAGEAKIEGSNDGATYAPTDVLIGAESIARLNMNPMHVRPSVTGDGTTNLTVIMIARSGRQ